MKTKWLSTAIVAMAIITGLTTFSAFGQPGVWVAHGPNTNWTGLASSGDGTKLVATAHLGLYTSTDSGVNWTPRDTSKYWTTVASSSDGAKLVAGADDLYTSTDSGASWVNRSLSSAFVSLASSADGSGLAAVEQGADASNPLLFSTDSGADWTTVVGWPSAPYFKSVACASNGVMMMAAVYNGQFYFKTNTLNAWYKRGLTNNWYGIACSGDGTKVVAVAYPGQIYTSTDMGMTWTARDSSRNWSCVASSADGTRLVAAVYGGLIYTSSDSGVTWTPSGSNQNWVSVASSADGMKLAAAVSGGQIYTYTVPLSNDQCSGAIALTPGMTDSMNTTNASSTGDPAPACQTTFGNGVWFTYTPTGNGPVLFSTCGSTFDTVLAVYSGSCGSLTPVACDDDYGPACSASRQASLSFSGSAGMTYYILAGGYGGATGILQITAQTANDQCSGAIALTNGVTYSMSTADATSAGDPSPNCIYNFGKGVWFTYTPATSRVVKVDTCGSDFDTGLQVYTGGCGSFTAVAGGCDDDSNICGSGRQSSVAFTAAAGTTYYILAGGYNGGSGNLSITASEVPIAITQQPVGGTANAGDSYTFNVTATGTNLSYQWQWGGVNYNAATNSSLTISDLDPTLAGNYRVIITNVYGAVTSAVAVLSVDPALALALETTGLTWTTGGDNGAWYRETLFTYDGVDAARCIGSITSPPWLQTTVTGPGTLSFYWGFAIGMFDSTTDYLGLQVDGVEVAKRNASRSQFTVYFYPQTIYLTSGSHTLKWVYDRNGGSTGGAYLDQVSYTSGATPAFIATQPASQTTVAGSNATFTVVAAGTPPLTYQWQFSGVNITNATNSSLILTNVQPIQGSNYSVLVANGSGSPATSSNALLTVTTVPLPVALDYAGPAWTSTGNAQWFGQVSMTHDGVDAAQSGWLTNNQQCTLKADLMGPGNLSFWWKVSSESNYDYLRFYTNGVQRNAISGDVDWQQQTFSLSTGKQTVVWVYSKDVSLSHGLDAGWVDQVTYDGSPILFVTPVSPGQISFSWPASVSGFSLQYATNLNPPVFWQSVTDVPIATLDNWFITNNTARSWLFYRLKK